MGGPKRRGVELVGRDRELASVQALLESDGRRSVVLEGGPGIGKTTLWEASIGGARARFRVIAARSSGAEVQLAFAALIDLLDGVPGSALAGLAAPQRRALEVALLRAEPVGASPEPRAIELGFFNALRELAAREPLLVAIDDLQWLDRASAAALAYAASRLEGSPVSFLLARRPGSASALERALEPRGLERLKVGPLSLGATRHLLHDRLGLSLPRRVLQQVMASSQGNPLLALELGRLVVEHGLPEPGEELAVPDRVDDLLGMRVGRLSRPLRRVLLAVALNGDLRPSELLAVSEPGSVDDALDMGLVTVGSDRVSPSHPLLATAARTRSRAAERRELHLALASAVTDDERRARHLALAAPRPDATLAATVSEAAARASARGAAGDAVDLAEHALRLTPPESGERSERLLTLAEALLVAGELERLTDVLAPEIEALPPGARRGRAHLLLLESGEISSLSVAQHHIERALAECPHDPAVRVTALARKAECAALADVAQIRDAGAWATEALGDADRAGPAAERLALYALAWVRLLRGMPLDDLVLRFEAASEAAWHIADSPQRVAGVRAAMRGDVDGARAIFTALRSLADERGEAMSSFVMRQHLCELSLRAGDLEQAAHALVEWEQERNDVMVVSPVLERCQALLAAGRGLHEQVERWATEAIRRAEITGVRWDMLEARRAQGIAAVVAGEPERAARELQAVWEHTLREGVDEPGAFPAAPDLVEALAELGELDQARAVTARLRDLAERQKHPWGRVTAERCDAVVRLAALRYEEEAAEALARAADAYGKLGLRFDRARSLLALGRSERRNRKWAAARRSLQASVAAFEELGATGWTEQAGSELARVGGRQPSRTGELTEAERRVTELAAEGRPNKQIAAMLHVTVHTVEVHLSHAYAKLGVRSRAQLARALSGGPSKSLQVSGISLGRREA